jgi:hypothetical protein
MRQTKNSMDDLLERLGRPVDPDDPNLWEIDRDRIDAAAEIKRLQAEIERLKEALYRAKWEGT